MVNVVADESRWSFLLMSSLLLGVDGCTDAEVFLDDASVDVLCWLVVSSEGWYELFITNFSLLWDMACKN